MIKKNEGLCLLILIMLNIPFIGYTQDIIEIKGKVIGVTDNLPIPGVTILIKGSSIGVTTDFDGEYSIQAKTGDNLIFSYVGLKNVLVKVTGTTLNVIMEEDTESLDEIIVVGYGTVAKKEITGAVNRIDVKDIEQFVTSDIASRLQGQVAGVSVSSSSGEPGEAANIQIRGVTSLSGSNSPLFVVNGIPQIEDPGLSPNEIESIDVLKDAASAAIYGSRGAAGVILITTKSGKEGKTNVNFDYNSGFQFLGEGTPLMDARDQLFFEIDTHNLFGGFPPFIENNPEWLENDNSFDDFVLVNAAEVQTYNLNIAGGSNGLTYNISGSLFDQDGALVNSNFRRYNGRISAAYTADKWKINASIASTFERRKRSSEGLIVIASRYKPYLPVIDPNSDVAFVNSSPGTQTPAVALGQALRRRDNSTRDRSNINLGLNRSLYKKSDENLDFITNIGFSVTNDNRNVFRPRFELFNIDDDEILVDPTRSGVTASSTRTTKFSVDGGLLYKKKFGKHNLSLQGVVTLEEDKNKAISASIEGITNNNVQVLNGGTLNENVNSGFDFNTKRVGTLGRLQYNYAGKYILSALVRYDGSSRFSRRFRFGTFPSVSVAWNVANERFWEPIKSVINNFKIRASHGEVGNDSFNDYEFASTIAPFADYVFDTQDGSVDFGSSIRSYANRDVKWETSISDNIGLDLSFFKNKFDLTVDYYHTRKEDMLFPVTLPGSSGAFYDPDLILNVGNMVNKGLEISANYRTSIGNKVKLTLGGTFTTNDNEITKVANEGIIFNSNSGLIAGDPNSTVSVIAEGFEAGAFFLFETNGTIKTQEELDTYRLFPSRANAQLGDLRYVDNNGDGNITNEDRVYKGSGLPDFEVGLNVSVQMGLFDFSMNWFGTIGSEILNGNRAATYGFERHQDLVNQWTPNNPTSNIPSFRGRRHPNYAGTTDYWLENGDYLRLKQATLGFSFPKDTSNSIGINKLRIYLSTQNPITITNYNGYDPEIGGNNIARRGIDQSRFPIAKIYNIGVKVDF
ncbi:SusC/RagA family TonB-linked outer membrane protein [Aquimarina aggregata]|uniref:SusC/RagA family TonB-linked outer membrane protein n=1 Tax=Aquimarina aggregata TaxID=1642818 RepID=UPI0024939C6C|nr:SusC/RagA family TonB-linked outer membrane protein [Aquimarina aggregata]